MREYKFYLISSTGHISAPPSVHQFPDDQSAINAANLAAASTDIEVWQGSRIVGYIVSDETKQSPPSRTLDADQHK